MKQNNIGRLSESERNELQTLVHEAEEITFANARLLVAERQKLTQVQDD